jgi:hypothetical protein
MRAFLLALPLLLGACLVGVGEVPPEGGGSGGDDTDPPLPPQPTTPKLDSIASGAFKAIAPYTNLAGSALMVRRLDGKTELSMAISGVNPTTAYTAHLHAAPCQYGGGGGHYKKDPAIVEVLENNELWLKGQSTMGGTLTVEASFDHPTRGGALSVVIHDPTAGAKMACADLISDDVATVEFSGTMASFASATTGDKLIAGSVTVVKTSNGTAFKLDVTNLDKTALAYGTHIHAEPCEITTGGGHYKLDTSVVDTLEANEIWLPIANYATTGAASSTISTPHMIRTDAQSIVLHRTISDTEKPKVACANLTRKTARAPLETTGTANVLATGMSMTGTAIMTRKLSGVTEVALVMTGLTPSTKYGAHVHNLPCAVEKGGGHYKFDKQVTEAIADNEIWFEMVADATGAASDATWTAKLAAADAQSLVVHGADGARLACFDLH